MTTLDSLARSSAGAVHASVASVPVPVRGIVWTAGWFYFRRSLGYALAGSAAAVAAVVALMLVSTPSEEVTDVTATTAATPITTATPITVAPPTTVTQNTAPSTTPPPEPTEPSTPVVVPPSGESQPPADTVAPRIQILSPDPDSSVKTSSVLVVGLTEPGADVSHAADQSVEVGEDGMWSTEVRLEGGQNLLTFTATDAAGNQATASVTVTRVVDRPRVTTTMTTKPPETTTTTTTKPPETTTTTKAPVEWEFAAHSTYGSCSEDPPYDVYYGTGKPGTAITISSEFGGGTAEVGENGEWSLKVFFPEAPAELVFTVKVKDFTGAKVLFEFVSYVGV